MARVTVCIPTYNRAHLLPEVIGSVLAQEGIGLRVVVSDNASTDDTEVVVRSIDDERLRYLRADTNRGLIANFNAAAAAADTELLAWLPDDDLLLPGSLARAARALDEHPTAGFVHSAFDRIDGDGRTIDRAVNWTGSLQEDTLERGRDFIRASLGHTSRICISASVFRRALLPDPPYDPAADPQPELLLGLRVALDHDVAFLAEPGAAFRIHEDADSTRLVHRLASGESHYRPEIMARIRDTKLAFVDECSARLEDPAGLRRLAVDLCAAQLEELLWSAPNRRTALAMAWTVGRVQAAELRRVAFWRILANRLAGPRLRALADRRRARV